jgi:hypothetical protein
LSPASSSAVALFSGLRLMQASRARISTWCSYASPETRASESANISYGALEHARHME